MSSLPPTSHEQGGSMIIALLMQKQKERGGYLVAEDLRNVAHSLNVELSHVQGLVSFYPHFHMSPPPKVSVKICHDMACHLRGSTDLAGRIKKWADEQYGEDVQVCQVACLGRCDRAPAALINDQLLVARSDEEMKQTIASCVNGQEVQFDTDAQWLNQRQDDWQIDVYADQPRDYACLRRYVAHPQPQWVIEALERAGLLGMGGAGGRTYLKWQDVRQARGTQKSVIGNADESEPGTFKDRDLMLRVPHLIIEGLVLAGLVVGAQRGFIFIRHEYPEQIDELRHEIKRARQLGALGQNLFHSSFNFELEVVVSPGNYIAGEQTALVEALEGNRAEPRNRPPELMTNGYQNQPTLLNNVETFAWVPAIVSRDAGRWFAQQGYRPKVERQSSAVSVTTPAQPLPTASDSSHSRRTTSSTGLRMFSVSGDVQKPGVYEVPCGITFGELLNNFCGGMISGKQLLAVSLSGASSGFLPAKIPLTSLNEQVAAELAARGLQELEVLDIPLDIQYARQLGIMLGAGIVVYGTGADVLKEALACSRFFRDQSCGKCVPCRIGAQKITQMGQRLIDGQVTPAELPAICQNMVELSEVMQATSICGLGQVAANPLRSILAYFPERVQEALNTSLTDYRESNSPLEIARDHQQATGEECTQ